MLLDIHTHHPAQAAGGRAILSLDLTRPLPDTLPPDILCSLSIHPWTLDHLPISRLFDNLHQWICHPQVIAIGEAGLDKLQGAPLALQTEIFRQVVAVSEKAGLPLILHNVRATGELTSLRKALRPDCPWIMHGFRGNPQQARELTERHGFHLSFGERFNDATIEAVDAKYLCLETDESLLAIEAILDRIASLRGTTPSALTESLQDNYRRLFTRLPRP